MFSACELLNISHEILPWLNLLESSPYDRID